MLNRRAVNRKCYSRKPEHTLKVGITSYMGKRLADCIEQKSRLSAMTSSACLEFFSRQAAALVVGHASGLAKLNAVFYTFWLRLSRMFPPQ